MRKNIYLIYPFIIGLLAFGLDKLFLLPEARKHLIHWKKMEMYFYESRPSLLAYFVEESKKRPDSMPGLILGSSRSSEFDSDTISEHYLPDSYTYNFSVPLGPPSFHYYWLEKTIHSGIVPKFVILEADPILFGKKAIEYSLAYSYDPSFVLSNTDVNREDPSDPWRAEGRGFSYDEAETYFLKQLFALYKFPFDAGAIRDNHKNVVYPDPRVGLIQVTGLQLKQGIEETVIKANKVKRGGIPNPLMIITDDRQMEKDAINMEKIHMIGYKPSVTQIIFFKKTLRLLAEHKIPVVIYWPVVSAHIRSRMHKHNLVSSFRMKMDQSVAEVMAKYPDSYFTIIDLNDNPRLQCRAFADSVHLSGSCFEELTGYLMEEVKHGMNVTGKLKKENQK